MASGLGSFDPATGEGTFTTDEGVVLTGNIADFYDGRFRVAGPNLVDTRNPSNTTPIGQAGNFSIRQLTQDRVQVVTETQAAQLNQPFRVTPDPRTGQPVYAPILRSVAGTVNFQTSTGEVLSFNVDPTNIAEIGKQWIRSVGPTGETQYFQARGPYINNAYVQRDFGPNATLARPGEAAFAALTKRVLDSDRTLLERLVNELGTAADTERTAEYRAVVQLLQMPGVSSLRYFNNFILE